jgi:hypothetical protein
MYIHIHNVSLLDAPPDSMAVLRTVYKYTHIYIQLYRPIDHFTELAQILKTFIRNQIVQYNQLSPEGYYSGICLPGRKFGRFKRYMRGTDKY